MKHHVFAISLFITTPCIAMEITAAEQNNSKKYAQFLDNNHIITGGEHGCNVVDLTTNKEILNISDKKCDILTLHPNKEKVALCNDTTITIYDTKTANAEWSTIAPKTIRSVTFNPLDTTIFFVYLYFPNHQIITHNYKTNEKYNDIYMLYDAPYLPIIACNPTKKEICATHPWGIEICSHQSTSRGIRTKNISNFFKYTPDGSHIVVGNGNEISIIDPNKNHQDRSPLKPPLGKYDEFFSNILFYSNSILAIISTAKSRIVPYNLTHSIVDYVDIHTNQQIDVSDRLDVSEHYDLSFSPDKTKIMINGCIFPVPFNVMYQPDTKEKFPYFLFLLKNYLNQQPDLEIPQEITPLIAVNLLEMFKR